MEGKTEEVKKDTNVKEEKAKEIITIKLIWVSEGSKIWEEMEDNGHVAEIEFDSGAGTKIYLQKGIANSADIAHELGHFLQHWCEQQKEVHFSHDEELSFAFEDLIREILRKRLYPEYRGKDK